ncbi:MAG: zf-HC2 domain-containing protein [Pyrinomonadaceae bacterium]
MNCTDFREMADSYLSNELLTETNHGFISHLEACGPCRSYLERIRNIRGRMRDAVCSAEQYRMREGFERTCLAKLREQTRGGGQSLAQRFFGWRPMALVAASLVVILGGYAMFSSFTKVSAEPYLVAGLDENDIVNVAAADHHMCAVDHKANLAVESASENPLYTGLDKLVSSEIGSQLGDQKLVSAHYCKYKGVSFAHYIFQGDRDTLSVLVAPAEDVRGTLKEEMVSFSSPDYQIAGFEVNRNAVFVISDLDREKNRRAANALTAPLKTHFEKKLGFETLGFRVFDTHWNAIG